MDAHTHTKHPHTSTEAIWTLMFLLMSGALSQFLQETVLSLLFRGASLKVKDIRGTSVLLAAVQAGHKEVVELLIRNGAQLEMEPLLQVGV